MGNVTTIIRTAIVVLILILLFVVKFLYSKNEQLTTDNIELAAQVENYKGTIDALKNANDLKAKINAKVVSDNIAINEKIADINAEFDELLRDNASTECSCENEDVPRIDTDTCKVIPKIERDEMTNAKRLKVEKVSNLIDAAWCTLEPDKQECKG